MKNNLAYSILLWVYYSSWTILMSTWLTKALKTWKSQNNVRLPNMEVITVKLHLLKLDGTIQKLQDI